MTFKRCCAAPNPMSVNRQASLPPGSGVFLCLVAGAASRPSGEAAPSGCAKRARDKRSLSPNKPNVTEGGYLNSMIEGHDSGLP
jgi:hypothetical protein